MPYLNSTGPRKQCLEFAKEPVIGSGLSGRPTADSTFIGPDLTCFLENRRKIREEWDLRYHFVATYIYVCNLKAKRRSENKQLGYHPEEK